MNLDKEAPEKVKLSRDIADVGASKLPAIVSFFLLKYIFNYFFYSCITAWGGDQRIHDWRGPDWNIANQSTF